MIEFYLNGQPVQAAAEHANWMLAEYLRQVRGLTGTKIVCAEGDCGACTVLRKRGDAFLPVNSCILTLGQLAGAELVTIEALAPSDREAHPVQNAMVACHGSQCGFCTPGFVMALAGLAEKKRARDPGAPSIAPQDAKNATTGNLCRCTGYQPIIDAACAIELRACAPLAKRFKAKAAPARAVRAGEFFAPTRLAEAVAFLKKHPRARVLAGGTDLGVVHNKRKLRLEQVVSLHLIPELRKIGEARGRIRVGAQATLAELREFCKKRVPELATFLDLFASPQIKNAATLAGNVANASPIGDTPPFLLAMDAVLYLKGPRGARRVPIREFFKGYRQTALRPAELIVAIEFARPAAGEVLRLRKVSQRKDLDISAVSGAFRVKLSQGKIQAAHLAYGGVAATPLYLEKTSRALEGRVPDEATRGRAIAALHAEIAPLADLRGSAAFRRVVAENLLDRFLRELGP